ncbi:hypothetical protein GCM10027569_44880 [Flindersiella endophytica]
MCVIGSISSAASPATTSPQPGGHPVGRLAAKIAAGTFEICARAVPLADIETAWTQANGAERIVVTP